jgi:hypothetical protein
MSPSVVFSNTKSIETTQVNSFKRDISCLALKGFIFAETLAAILNDTTIYCSHTPLRPAPLLLHRNQFNSGGKIPSRFIKYSMLQATAMLPGTDKAVGRLVDMNYELN